MLMVHLVTLFLIQISLTVTSFQETKAIDIPVDEDFSFDGTSSDLAQHFYNLYLKDISVTKPNIKASELTEHADKRLQKHLLKFDDLRTPLQHAFLWDCGLVSMYSDLDSYSQVYTRCGETMASIALSLDEYESTGCTAQECGDPSKKVDFVYRSEYCTGEQMIKKVRCAAENGLTHQNSSMWATGGYDSFNTLPNMMYHVWEQDGKRQEINAIHTVIPEHTWGSCPSADYESSMIIPCVPKNLTDDGDDWCIPEPGDLVEAWLQSVAEDAKDKNRGKKLPLWAPKTESAPTVGDALSNFDDKNYRYSGETSDFAKQYFHRYMQGDVVDKLGVEEHDLPKQIRDRLDEQNVKFSDLHGLLQRALLWDSGYIFTIENKLVRVQTEGGKPMSDIAVPAALFEGVCSSRECKDSQGVVSLRSENCTGDNMLKEASCAIEYIPKVDDGASMWATGGNIKDIPNPVAARHEWREDGVDYLVFAVHTVPKEHEPMWGECAASDGYYAGPVIPCVPLTDEVASVGDVHKSRLLQGSNWKDPKPSRLVDAWLKDAANGSSNSTMYLIIGIVAACVVLIIVGAVWRWRYKAKDRTKDGVDANFDGIPENENLTQPTVHQSDDMDSQFHVLYSPPAKARKKPLLKTWDDPIIHASRIPFEKLLPTKLLGRGAYGEVYKASYRGKLVAMKRLRPEFRKDMHRLEDFFVEAKVLASLEHARIVEFIGVAFDALTDISVVTEYMDRGDLRSYLKELNAADAPVGFNAEKLTIALHVAHALTYLHSLQPMVIHRDLKSRNILLNNNLEAKITDFGTSREVEENTLTAAVGTGLWMAPECLMGERYDEKADIFSFGVVLSELDTHKLPYSHAREVSSGNPRSDFALLQLVAIGRVEIQLSTGENDEMEELAKACVSLDPSVRPTAAKVLYTIHELVK